MSGGKGYRDLDVFQLAKRLAVEVHKMSLTLPKYELYEEGSQIRRSSKSVVSNLVEGYCRRNYKSEFLRFLTISIAECNETSIHLELLYETGSLKDTEIYKNLSSDYEKLGKMLNRFYQAVFRKHLSEK